MAIRLRIALVVGLVLVILMEDIKPMLAKRWYGCYKYRRLEARVKKLEDALSQLDLDCERKKTTERTGMSAQTTQN